MMTDGPAAGGDLDGIEATRQLAGQPHPPRVLELMARGKRNLEISDGRG